MKRVIAVATLTLAVGLAWTAEPYHKPIKTIGDMQFRGDGEFLHLAPSEDGKALETLSCTGIRTSWDIKTRKPKKKGPLNPKQTPWLCRVFHTGSPTVLAAYASFPNGPWTSDVGLYAIDTATGIPRQLVRAEGNELYRASISAGQKHVGYVTGPFDKEWNVRSMQDGSIVQSNPKTDGDVWRRWVDLSKRDDTMLELVEYEKHHLLRRWKIGAKEPIWEIKSAGTSSFGEFGNLFWRPRHEQVAVFTSNKTKPLKYFVECIDLKTRKSLWKHELPQSARDGHWASDGSHFILETYDFQARVLEGESGKKVTAFWRSPGDMCTAIGGRYYFIKGSMILEFDSNWKRTFPSSDTAAVCYGFPDFAASSSTGEIFVGGKARVNAKTAACKQWGLPEKWVISEIFQSSKNGLIAYHYYDRPVIDDSHKTFITVLDPKTNQTVRNIPSPEGGLVSRAFFSQCGNSLLILTGELGKIDKGEYWLHKFSLDSNRSEVCLLPMPADPSHNTGTDPFIATTSTLRIIGVINGKAYVWDTGPKPRIRKITDAYSVGAMGAGSDTYAFLGAGGVEIWKVPSAPGNITKEAFAVNSKLLGDGTPKQRKAAAKRLIEAGLALDVDALLKGREGDPEIVERVKSIEAEIQKRFAPSKVATLKLKDVKWGDCLIDNRSSLKGFIRVSDRGVNASSDESTVIDQFHVRNNTIIKVDRYASGALYWGVAFDGESKLYGSKGNGTFDVYDLKKMGAAEPKP